MEKKAAGPSTVDEYIRACAPEVRARLERLRTIIKDVAPEAEEGMGYGMPAFTHKGPLAYFAAFERHIGFYPLPSSIEEFEERLKPYKHAKGSVQFPLDQEPPYDLVRDMVRFRLEENERKAAEKSMGKKKRRT
jgi:uncharacterized protein YdhG (YjbR/CyaY superfamily)